MESKLMPCICGGEDGWACWKTSDETYYLECESCGYKTKEHKTVADAETEWDKRNGAPMTTSEPTTGEIVRALRCDGDANNCVDCRYATFDTATVLCDQEQNVRDAADRLESLQRENERLQGEMFANALESAERIASLTARAEQAENKLRELKGCL